MKYHCGHEGCDICGARVCAGVPIRKIGIYGVCDSCVLLAVKFAVNAAETFGGTVIEPDKPCARKAVRMTEPEKPAYLRKVMD